MSWFKKIFPSEGKSSEQKDKTVEIASKDLSPEHKEIVEKYIQENPTPVTSMEIIEGIAKELEKKPGGVRSILSKAGVYIKHEARTWKNDKELAIKRAVDGDRYIGAEQLSDELINDKEVCEALVDTNASNLEKLPDKFKFDRELVIRALNQEISLLFFGTEFSEKFSRDKEICSLAFDSGDEDVGDQEDCILLEDKEFMLKAVKIKKTYFLNVHDSLKNNAELLSLVGADSFLDYLDHYDEYLAEDYPDYDEDEDEDEDEDVIEIP